MRKVGKTAAAIGTRKRKLDLYATVAIGGLYAVLVTAPGRAQSVNPGVSFTARNIANPSPTPSASMTTGTGTTDVQVLAPKAIIDWGVPAGTTDYNFIQPGTTTTFSSSGDFTVLNVVNVTSGSPRAMQFNGGVVSRINGAPGGNVWFYSPGGIIVGNNASFDVGSLLLTTLNPDSGNLPGANFNDFNNGTSGATIGFVTDGSAPLDVNGNNISQVQIGGTAAILAQNYVGIVAPRIVKTGGSIRTGGAIGFAAGEQVNLDIESSGGLFGISIPIGSGYQGSTEATAAIVHTGGNVGTDGVGTGSVTTALTARQIQMVAVPKNTAVTMLLTGGNIGYGASSASAGSDGVIVLADQSASTFFNGSGEPSNSVASGLTTTGTVLIGGATSLVDANFSSNLAVVASATDASASTSNLGFTGTTIIEGGLSSHLTVGTGRTVTVNGDMQVNSRNYDEAGYDVRGRDATVSVDGTLRIASVGTLKVDASSSSNSGSSTGIAGGLATLQINDGTLEGETPGVRSGPVSVLADAIGGSGLAQGGTASVLMTGGTARLSGLTIQADGTGSDNFFDTPGAGHGGIASLTVNDGTVTPTVDIGGSGLLISASGTGGTAIDDDLFFDGSGDLIEAPGLAGAAGTGGSATLTVATAGNSFGLSGQGFNINLDAGGVGGGGGLAAASMPGPYPDGGAGGLGQGGTATLNISQGISRLRAVSLTANGQGGAGGDGGDERLSPDSGAGNGGAGGEGKAGIARAILSGNAQILGNGSGYSLLLSGLATGGNGGGSFNDSGGVGGVATANGQPDGISLTVSGSAFVSRESISLAGIARGGDGGAGSIIGGDGGAASASATLVTAPSGGFPQIATGSISLIGSATGGFGGFGSGESAGGSAFGGAATIDIAAGTFAASAFSTLTTIASGTGASGSIQGTSVSGNAAVTATGAAVSFSSLSINTYADNGGIALQNGAAAVGGAIALRALNGGQLSSANAYTLDSHASGGGGTATSASGTGGAITIEATSASQVNAGVNAFSRLTSYGVGGSDPFGDGGTTGGNGVGGDQSIAATNSSVVDLGAGGLQLSAYGRGGSGENSGIGTGGNVTIAASGNQSLFTIGSGLSVATYAQSGSGTLTGDSNGGGVVLRANDGAFQIASNGLSVDAGSNAGAGGAITIETLGSEASSTPSFIVGRTTLSNTAAFDDPITIRNAVTGTNTPLTLGQLDVTSADGIVIETGSNAITGGNVDLSGLTIQISALSPASGGLISSGSFYASAQNSITVSGVNGAVPTITARSIELNYANIDTRGSLLVANGDGTQGGADGTIVIGSLTLAQLGNLQATQGIDVTASGGITIGNASVTATATDNGSGAINTDVGYVRLTAGDYFAPNDSRNIDPSAQITIAGAVSATANISVTAPDSARIASTGALLSENGIDLSIGNDLVVDAGGVISGLISPLAGTGSNLTIFFSGSGSANSVINRGTITANGGALDISASAVDSIGGTFGGDTVTVSLAATSFAGDDDGQLSAGCFIGSICIGSVNALSDLNVGATGPIPTAITLGGAITAGNLNATASNGIALGSGGIANVAITNNAVIDAGNGAITGIGTGTVSGATLSLRSVTGLVAPDYTFQTTVNDLSLDVEGAIQVGGLVSAGRLGSNPDGFVNGLAQTGDFAAGLVSVGVGDIDITAPNVTIGSLAISNGNQILLNAQGGTLTLTAAVAAPLGTAQSALLQGNTITVGALTTLGDTTFIGSGSVSVADLLAGGVVNASADNVAITSSGAMNVASLNATGAILRAAGLLTVSGIVSASALGLTSDTAGVTVNGAQSVGAATVRAAGNIALDTFTGTSIDFETSSGDIIADSLTSTGGTRVVTPGTITLPVLSSTGAIDASGGAVQIGGAALTFASLNTTGGDAQVTTSGDLVVNNGTAAGSASFTSTAGRVTATNYSATQDITLLGATIGDFANLTGRNISITAQTGSVSGAALNAAGTTFLQAPINVSVSALNSTGGVTANARGLSLSAPAAMTITSATAGVGGMTLSSGGLLTVNSSTSAADSILESTGGGIAVGTVSSVGTITLSGAGAITATSISGSRVTVQTTAGGITAQTITAASTAPNPGTITLSAPGAISVTNDFRAASASVTGSNVAITSSQDLTFSALTATTGDISVQTPGSVTVNSGSAAGAGSFSSGGTLNLVSYTTGTDLILSAARLPSFGTLSARNISLTALASDLTGGTLIASGTTNLSASGVLRITDLRSAGAATLSGATVDVGSTVALNVANATAGDGRLRLRSTGALTVANATSNAGVDLASIGGNVTAGTITMTGTPAGITQQAVAGTSPLTIASAGTTTLDGAITGAGAATISGTGLVLNNLIDASGISLASQTIVVGSQAAIGTLARTGTVAFTNSGTGRSFIGGTGSQTGYSLDANALSRIQASSVTLSLPLAASSSTATPDVVIGGFTLYGPGGTPPAGARQNLGAGLLSISTPGLVQVNGPVRLANLQSTGTSGLAIRAAGIDVVTPTGSILQTDASGAPAGTLDLNARTVRVASARALADLATLATPAEREARLAQNDGNMSDVGWLGANTIRFSYPSGTTGGNGLATVYVQNSGGNGATARRGLTTGAGGVVIAGFPSGDQPEVFINGRLQTSPTTFVTGTAFLQSISQTGSATDILVNGCALATGVCTGDNTGLALISLLAPPQDLIGVISNSTEEDDDEDTNEPGDPVPSRDPNAIIQFASPDPEMGSQTTDDPVVGSGNESLWSGSSGAGEAGGTSSFDTTIGIGNDAGSPDSGGNTSRSGAGGANSGSTPQQPGERATGLTPTGGGGLGVGNDAGSGGEQRSGNGTSGAARSGAGGSNTPNTPNSPANLQNGGGAVGIGGDTGGAGGAGSGANSGGGTLPGGTQGTTGGTTNGGTNNGRGNGAAAADQTTGTGGDAGGTSGSGAGTSGSAGAAGAGTPGTTTNPNNNNRQTNPNAPR